MSYKSRLVIKESLEELKSLLHSTTTPQTKLKIKSLIIFKEGKFKKQENISEHLCIGSSTLRLWYKNYRTQGLAAFLKVLAKGKPKSVISPSVHISLENKLNDSQKPLRGYWEAVEWVSDNHGINVNYQTLRAYMIRNFKSKLKVPRKSHYKSDEQAKEAFLKTS